MVSKGYFYGKTVEEKVAGKGAGEWPLHRNRWEVNMENADPLAGENINYFYCSLLSSMQPLLCIL